MKSRSAHKAACQQKRSPFPSLSASAGATCVAFFPIPTSDPGRREAANMRRPPKRLSRCRLELLLRTTRVVHTQVQDFVGGLARTDAHPDFHARLQVGVAQTLG